MSDRPYRGKPKNQTSPEQQVVEAIFKGIAALFRFIFRRGKGPEVDPALVGRLRDAWEQVELHALSPATLALAISDADKVFDGALQMKRVAGQTLGERLKAAEHLFPAELYQNIWQAHKLRNTLAHEVGAQVSSQEASLALSTFRRALNHLGII